MHATITPTFAVDAATLTTFLLVLARTTAWSVSSPILSTRLIASPARLAVGVALAVFLTPLVPRHTVPTDLAGFVNVAVMQTLVGLALGFLTGLLLTAVEMAGNLADYASGMAYGAQLDPVSGAQSAAFQRLGNLTMLALLFATDGAGVIVAGFARSFTLLPLGTSPHLSGSGAAMLGHILTQTTLSALQIGAPLLGAIFLTDVGLALVARLVPQANVLNVGLTLKALVAFSTLGGVLVLLPNQLSDLLDPAVRMPSTFLQSTATSTAVGSGR